MQFIVNTSQVCLALDCKVMITTLISYFSIVLGDYYDDNYCNNDINISLS